MTHDKTQTLRDDHARRIAMCVHDQSILVEAGAGSGKTAVMAGRIALMLANGVAPRAIAAVTFTELAASELISRVREFVAELSEGKIGPELRIALPDGLSPAHLARLAESSAAIDEITCSTIHGFCQRLIKPYPVEADLDPGASVMVRNQGDLVFGEIADGWLREALAGTQTGVLAEMVLKMPAETVRLVTKIAENLRRRRTLCASAAPALQPRFTAFLRTAAAFADFVRTAPVPEAGSAQIAEGLEAFAATLAVSPNPAAPAALVRMLVTRPERVFTKSGGLRAYSRQQKWIDVARAQGLSRAEGIRLNDEAKALYQVFGVAWNELLEAAASHALSALIDDAKQILARYREYKRTAALLDFDDLIFAARDLLREHDAVRRALGKRYRYVLVDEFQDTDPLQTEIFWRLCGDPASGADSRDWTRFRIRPGALFLVGDPKQAIYRFRGADVGAYVMARDAFRAQNPQSVLSISTNFRSCAPILDYVNARFQNVLSVEGQPGFTALDPFHGDRGEQACVAALDIAVPDAPGEADTARQRDAEAESVGDLCARLVGSASVLDRRTGEARPCRPGDIALLAPTGSDLWRYEEALERRGIPVATQAGKGFFRRQEIQDLIAITRVLADRKDALALGALLRGPLVGLTDEDLLDIVWALPRAGEGERVGRLDLAVDGAAIAHPLARDMIGKLQALAKRSHVTTPHDLLSQAIDVMRVRHVLRERHGREAERALANVDLYLGLSTDYAVRGLGAFAEAMTLAWSDEEKAVEGQADAPEESVALLTMHAAKGLEWPVVIPVNTMTGVKPADGAVAQRATDTFLCPVLGVEPIGYASAREDEKTELDRERIRLWYVAATRARELLVLPRLDVEALKNAWIGLFDLAIGTLPALDVERWAAAARTAAGAPENVQTRATFAAEARTIEATQRTLAWLAPSRDEGTSGPVLQAAPPEALQEIESVPEASPGAGIQGSRERGLILHKLFEEVLTGETDHDPAALAARAEELIAMFPRLVSNHAASAISAQELAQCVARTFALPEIAPLRAMLVPEYPVYHAIEEDGGETATAGIADALTLGADGRPAVVIDWKSDVRPDARTVEHYRAQVRAYLDMTGAERGLIVFVTTGAIVAVEPSLASAATA
ncbi:UvrD-helicase domain-containing protein [Caballeronia novacaledonica]|uniref:UvrD-helicase domain-containing protein n=1 Tax=Caballeronia novacaledonica TaxID=1544861 RepID=UPI001EE36666|nr:UvrD-helicase domain-containing protein [Caballeronia novacaledonica]GJH14302.1 UvrD-helicase domain-containing protein [Caballeronia novacaledonica]